MTIPTNSNQQQLPSAQREMVDQVMGKIQSLTETGLLLPKDYHAENSLRTAWLILQDCTDRNNKPVLEVCTKPSIANALLKMVLHGLNASKQQCAFIAMGTQLTLMVEYPGKIAIAKRIGLIGEPIANVVYEGDLFEYQIDPETGRKKINKHEQKLSNTSGKILGTYCVIETPAGKNVEIMTMAMIQASWNQGAAKGQSPAHKNFPDQMCIKTVISRALKIFINSSSDNDLQKIEDEEFVQETTAIEVKKEIAAKANATEFSFEDAPITTATVEVKTETVNENKENLTPGF